MKIQDHYEFPECDHRRLPSSSDWKDGARWSDLSSRYSAGRKVGSPAGFYFARSVEHSPGVYRCKGRMKLPQMWRVKNPQTVCQVIDRCLSEWRSFSVVVPGG